MIESVYECLANLKHYIIYVWFTPYMDYVVCQLTVTVKKLECSKQAFMAIEYISMV